MLTQISVVETDVFPFVAREEDLAEWEVTVDTFFSSLDEKSNPLDIPIEETEHTH